MDQPLLQQPPPQTKPDNDNGSERLPDGPVDEARKAMQPLPFPEPEIKKSLVEERAEELVEEYLDPNASPQLKDRIERAKNLQKRIQDEADKDPKLSDLEKEVDTLLTVGHAQRTLEDEVKSLEKASELLERYKKEVEQNGGEKIPTEKHLEIVDKLMAEIDDAKVSGLDEDFNQQFSLDHEGTSLPHLRDKLAFNKVVEKAGKDVDTLYALERPGIEPEKSVERQKYLPQFHQRLTDYVGLMDSQDREARELPQGKERDAAIKNADLYRKTFSDLFTEREKCTPEQYLKANELTEKLLTALSNEGKALKEYGKFPPGIGQALDAIGATQDEAIKAKSEELYRYVRQKGPVLDMVDSIGASQSFVPNKGGNANTNTKVNRTLKRVINNLYPAYTSNDVEQLINSLQEYSPDEAKKAKLGNRNFAGTERGDLIRIYNTDKLACELFVEAQGTNADVTKARKVDVRTRLSERNVTDAELAIEPGQEAPLDKVNALRTSNLLHALRAIADTPTGEVPKREASERVIQCLTESKSDPSALSEMARACNGDLAKRTPPRELLNVLSRVPQLGDERIRSEADRIAQIFQKSDSDGARAQEIVGELAKLEGMDSLGVIINLEKRDRASNPPSIGLLTFLKQSLTDEQYAEAAKKAPFIVLPPLSAEGAIKRLDQSAAHNQTSPRGPTTDELERFKSESESAARQFLDLTIDENIPPQKKLEGQLSALGRLKVDPHESSPIPVGHYKLATHQWCYLLSGRGLLESVLETQPEKARSSAAQRLLETAYGHSLVNSKEVAEAFKKDAESLKLTLPSYASPGEQARVIITAVEKMQAEVAKQREGKPADPARYATIVNDLLNASTQLETVDTTSDRKIAGQAHPGLTQRNLVFDIVDQYLAVQQGTCLATVLDSTTWPNPTQPQTQLGVYNPTMVAARVMASPIVELLRNKPAQDATNEQKKAWVRELQGTVNKLDEYQAYVSPAEREIKGPMYDPVAVRACERVILSEGLDLRGAIEEAAQQGLLTEAERYELVKVLYPSFL